MARRTSDAQSIMNVPVDDSSIGNGKVLAYNSTSGALEYVTPSGAGDMLTSTYDAANVAEQLVGLTAIQTLTNKTLTSPVLNTGVSGTAVLDEDNMASNSATQLATQQSIKAYVDGTNVTLAGTGTYITIAGQVITVDPITESDIADLGAYITGITGEPLSDLSDVTITTIASGEILKWNGSAWINQTLAEAGIQGVLSEGAFVDGDKTKLDGIEASADVTDTANVTSAGALMDSEVTNLAAVKAFDPTDYVAATGDTMEGDLAMGDQDITGVGAVRFTQQLDNGSKTTSFSVDFATDQHQKVTLTANTMTLTLDTTNIGVGVYTLEIVNGGLATLTWASETGSITWAGGAAPTLTSSGTDVVSLLWTGSAWRGQASLAFA